MASPGTAESPGARTELIWKKRGLLSWDIFFLCVLSSEACFMAVVPLHRSVNFILSPFEKAEREVSEYESFYLIETCN